MIIEQQYLKIFTNKCSAYLPSMISASLLWLAVAVWPAAMHAGADAPTEPTSVVERTQWRASASPVWIALCVAALIDVGTRRAGPSALVLGLKLATRTQRRPDFTGSPAWVTLPEG